MNRALSCFVAGVVSSSLLGCASGAMLPQAATVGPQPTIPKPAESLIPVMRTPKAVGWPAGGAPVAPAGFAVSRFAEGLDHPRWIQVLANGDVLVALSSTEPTKVRSIKDMVMQSIMKRVGALQESPNQIILLRDANADGVAETRSVLLSQGLNQPFGMAVLRGHLYVGNTDSLVRFPFQPGQTQITAAPEKVVDLPHAEGGHWTRNVIPSRDGSRLFVTVGSLSNIGDEGMAVEENRAAIWEIDPASKSYKVYARGLRNPNGLAWEPSTGTLFTVVNERDLIGDDASPDYLTSVRQGAHYGWPWAYWGRVDDRVEPPNPAVANSAVKPDYALGSHVAALGLTFYEDGLFPAAYRGGAFIGEHGSWNRSEYSGYKVVFVPFAGGRPSGPPQDFLTGFLADDNRVYGRPVGVTVAGDGALLVADDVGDVVWRVAPARAGA